MVSDRNARHLPFFVALTSCEKERFPLKSTTYHFSSNEFATLYNRLPEINYGSLSVIGDGILRFQSFEHLETVYNQLEKNCDIWDSMFLASHADMSDLQLEDYEILNGYDEFLPLVVFEHEYNVSSTSLRRAQAVAFDNWMNNNLIGEMPFDPIINDDVEQTLFNIFHEICIGDTIYSMSKDGTVLIPIDSIRNMKRYRQLSFEELSVIFPVIQKVWDGTIEYAYIPAGKKDTMGLSSTERICINTNAAAWFRINGSTKPKLVSKIINQKYKSNRNKWVRTRRETSLKLGVDFYWERGDINTGVFLDNGTTGELVDTTKTRKKKTMKVKVKGTVAEADGYYYRYGVKRNPQLTIKINGVERPLPIVF